EALARTRIVPFGELRSRRRRIRFSAAAEVPKPAPRNCRPPDGLFTKIFLLSEGVQSRENFAGSGDKTLDIEQTRCCHEISRTCVMRVAPGGGCVCVLDTSLGGRGYVGRRNRRWRRLWRHRGTWT